MRLERDDARDDLEAVLDTVVNLADEHILFGEGGTKSSLHGPVPIGQGIGLGRGEDQHPIGEEVGRIEDEGKKKHVVQRRD